MPEGGLRERAPAPGSQASFEAAKQGLEPLISRP